MTGEAAMVGSVAEAGWLARTGPWGVDGGLPTRQEDFAAILARGGRRRGTPEEQAREAAEQFVAMSLVQPLLAQLRATNMAAEPFAPSRGEQQFRAMADAQTARQIVRARQFPLVDSVAQHLLRGGGGAGGKGGERQ